MSQLTAPFDNNMKNFMLDAWRTDGTISVRALDGAIAFSTAVVAFNAASNGKITLTANATLNVPDDDTYTLTNFELRKGTGASAVTQMVWNVPLAEQEVFENGGNIVITLLEIEIED